MATSSEHDYDAVSVFAVSALLSCESPHGARTGLGADWYLRCPFSFAWSWTRSLTYPWKITQIVKDANLSFCRCKYLHAVSCECLDAAISSGADNIDSADYQITIPSRLMEKRNRPPASCEPCRARKLKCNRESPCDTCTRRQVGCVYASNARRGPRLPSKESQLRDKLNKLEGLVSSLLARQSLESTAQLVPSQSSSPYLTLAEQGRNTSHSTPATSASSVLTESPRPVANQNGLMCYVDASHWQSVLEELKEVRENLVSAELPSPPEHSSSSASLPMLADIALLDIEEILLDLPIQPVCNSLLSAFFTSQYSHLSIVHPEIFKMGYDKFWASPEQPTDLIWLALLFAILAMVMTFRQLSQGIDDSVPSARTLQQRTVQCLVLGNYQKADANVIEVLLLHMHSRFLTDKQGQLQMWLMLGHTVQLAFRLAYHRDPSRLSNCSVIEGEMRRRVWLNLKQVEALGSFQVGLPSMIQNAFCDTSLPGNYDATDLSIGMDSLPPPRAPTHRTSMLYAVSKDPIMTVFKKITQHVQTLTAVTYDRTVALDLEMREVYSNLPVLLQRKDVDEAYMDSSALIWDRATIEILYFKGLIVLHRYYLRHDHRNPRFNHSRNACIEAALAISSRQVDLHKACLPGGRLHGDHWMLSALTVYDFILAAMVICLDLSTRLSASHQHLPLNENETKELQALQKTRDIWKASKGRPDEVLIVAKTLDQVIKLAEDRQRIAMNTINPDRPPSYEATSYVNTVHKQESFHTAVDTADTYAADPMWDMIEGGGDLDWPLLDQYFLGNAEALPGSISDYDLHLASELHPGGWPVS